MESENEGLQYAKDIVANDPWSTYLGIELQEVRPRYARVAMRIRPEYCNAVERAHGAAVYSAADQAFAVACNSDGQKAVALTVTVHYLAGAPAGSTIIAEAQPISILRKISLWKIEVKTEDGTLIATAEGTAYHR